MTPAERIQAVIDMVLAEMPERVSRAELLGDSRRPHVLRARDMAALTLACAGGLTQRAIGRALRRDPSTISVALDRASRRCTEDQLWATRAHILVTKAEELFA